MPVRDDCWPPLPDSLAEIAEVIGRADTLRLVGSLPASGSRKWRVCFYVPKKIEPDHFLVGLLGWKKARALGHAFAGMILQPSNGKNVMRQIRNRQIKELAKEGQPPADIAAAVGLSEYTVRRILRGDAPEARRPSLRDNR